MAKTLDDLRCLLCVDPAKVAEAKEQLLTRQRAYQLAELRQPGRQRRVIDTSTDLGAALLAERARREDRVCRHVCSPWFGGRQIRSGTALVQCRRHRWRPFRLRDWPRLVTSMPAHLDDWLHLCVAQLIRSTRAPVPSSRSSRSPVSLVRTTTGAGSDSAVAATTASTVRSRGLRRDLDALARSLPALYPISAVTGSTSSIFCVRRTFASRDEPSVASASVTALVCKRDLVSLAIADHPSIARERSARPDSACESKRMECLRLITS